jgi:hypothetical protein
LGEGFALEQFEVLNVDSPGRADHQHRKRHQQQRRMRRRPEVAPNPWQNWRAGMDSILVTIQVFSVDWQE